jgi:hypothetical protein
VEKYIRKPNTSCIICQTPIYRRPFEINKNKGKIFCSMRCYGLSCRKENPCVVCEKLILASKNKKTCSRICSNKYRIGIKYKIGRPKDKANIFRVLKLKLINEKGKGCERCNYKKCAILQIHHKNRNRMDNSIENLEIICPNCHYEEHYLEKSWLNKKY